jgi:SAM-dependent methyltransferase
MRGEIESIDFRGAAFEIITLFHVLEHVPDPKAVIEGCKSLLSGNGILVIAVPNDISWLRKKAIDLLKRIGVGRFATTDRLGLPRITLDGSLHEIHLSHFTPAVLRRLVEASGFAILEQSLDPYWAESGMKSALHGMYYRCCSLSRTSREINRRGRPCSDRITGVRCEESV